MDEGPLKPNDPCQAFYKNRWELATVVELGRKWAKVRINGLSYNSKVLMDAIRKLPEGFHKPAEAPVAVVAVPPTPEYTIVYESSYIKIFFAGVPIAVFPAKYRDQAITCLAALRGERGN